MQKQQSKTAATLTKADGECPQQGKIFEETSHMIESSYHIEKACGYDLVTPDRQGLVTMRLFVEVDDKTHQVTDFLWDSSKTGLKAIHWDASDDCKEVPFWALAIIIDGHMALSLAHTTGQSLPIGLAQKGEGNALPKGEPSSSSNFLYCPLLPVSILPAGKGEMFTIFCSAITK